MIPIFDNIKISKFVAISGILTFLYLIELCIGARTVYYVFHLWNSPADFEPLHAKVSWTLCVACLLTAVASSFIVNFISALWEQKQMKEGGKEKSVLRFALHLLAGGMLWRYVAMWFSDNEEEQKRQALLLTMAKFLFTHFFTIPLIIVHTSLIEDLEELIYDLCSVLCISFNLLLTCLVFAWGKKLVSDLQKWNYETIDLVPLIFSQSFLNEEPPKEKNTDSTSGKNDDKAQELTNEVKESVEQSLVRLVVLLQTFCFSFGRLLALGILLKLAGIYAISIMFLQLLASVIYLKFQVPILVSDSLQKWRQLTRLAFMSYILIFEWHLNRDSNTGYDFDSNIKHSVIYYSVATIESVFYLITWAVTASLDSDDIFDEYKGNQSKFPRIIVVIGSLTLVASLIMHLILLMWRSRRISTLVYSVKRKYACFKMSIKRDKEADKNDSVRQKQIEISHPIPINNLDQVNCGDENEASLEKHNSYQDLREPLDDEIEIYSKEKVSKIVLTLDKKVNSPAKVFVKMQQKASSSIDSSDSSLKRKAIKKEGNLATSIKEGDDIKIQSPDRSKKCPQKAVRKKKGISCDSAIDGNVENKNFESSRDPKNTKNSENTVAPDTVEVNLKNEISNEKSKVVAISGTFSDQWNKLSLASEKFSGTIREQFRKQKEKFQVFRSNSTEKPSKKEKKVRKKRKPNDSKPSNDEPPKQFIGEVYSTEGCFVGDEREHEENVSYPIPENSISESKSSINENVALNKEDEKHLSVEVESSAESVEVESSEEDIDDDIEPRHCVDGDDPCSCFVCKTGNVGLSRRRSSSVPPPERRKILKSETLHEQKELSRYPSSPIVSQNGNSANYDSKEDTRQLSLNIHPIKRIHNLSLMSTDRVEHYV